jgi:hypothetical protein
MRCADDDIDDVLSRPEKVSPALLTLLQPAVDEVKATSSSPVLNVKSTFIISSLVATVHTPKTGSSWRPFKRTSIRTFVLAACGRYAVFIADPSSAN